MERIMYIDTSGAICNAACCTRYLNYNTDSWRRDGVIFSWTVTTTYLRVYWVNMQIRNGIVLLKQELQEFCANSRQ